MLLSLLLLHKAICICRKLSNPGQTSSLIDIDDHSVIRKMCVFIMCVVYGCMDVVLRCVEEPKQQQSCSRGSEELQGHQARSRLLPGSCPGTERYLLGDFHLRKRSVSHWDGHTPPSSMRKRTFRVFFFFSFAELGYGDILGMVKF